jgi:excisionase family DNA binding protein
VNTLQLRTIKDLAEIFQVNESTIKRMIYAKKINAIKFGGQWRITEEEYQRLKEGKR